MTDNNNGGIEFDYSANLGNTHLIFTLEGDQNSLVANFGPYLPIQINGMAPSIMQAMIDQLQTMLNQAVDASATATTAAQQATLSASTASTDAQQAHADATAIANDTSTSTINASNAAASATQAQTYAAQAQQAATGYAPLTPTTSNMLNLGTATFKYANMYATTFNGVATSAQYADLAERYEADCALEPGDVVMLGGAKEITKTNEPFSLSVFGVVSTAPAFRMNAEAGNDTTHPYVAFCGRVPVKVVGPVQKGQRLVSSGIPGVAIAADQNDIDSSFVVIGRALSDKTTDGVELLETAVGAK